MTETVTAVEELSSLDEGSRVRVEGEVHPEWQVQAGRLVSNTDTTISLSFPLLAGHIKAGRVTYEKPSPPFEGDVNPLVAALRELARTSEDVRRVLVEHGAAELRDCTVTVNVHGTLFYDIPRLTDPFEMVSIQDGYVNWRRTVQIVRKDVMTCQCGTVTRDEVSKHIPQDGTVTRMDWSYEVSCNLH